MVMTHLKISNRYICKCAYNNTNQFIKMTITFSCHLNLAITKAQNLSAAKVFTKNKVNVKITQDGIQCQGAL